MTAASHDIEVGDHAVLRVYADDDLTAVFAASDLLCLLRHMALLPTVQSPVEVFPDVVHKPFGFAAGTVVTCAGDNPFVYPTAVPDVACGYNVIATGVDATAWIPKRSTALLAALTDAIGVGSAQRRPIHNIAIDAILTQGLDAIPAATDCDDRDAKADQRIDWSPKPALLSEGCRETLTALLGSVTGHFVTLYTVDRVLDAAHDQRRAPQTGEIIAVIHTGAPTISAYAYERFFVPIAERCLERDDIDAELIAEHGLYGIPADEPLADDFLSLTTCAALYGYANRQLVAERVLQTLVRHALPRELVAEPTQLRHTSHAAFDPGPAGAIVARRGVQPLRITTDAAHQPALAFITGGERTHGYLVAPGERCDAANWRCGHGTPLWQRPLDRQDATTDLDRLAAGAPDVAANTPFHEGDFWRDAINLEAVVASMERTGLAQPTARLHPLVNYKELLVDVTTRR